MVPAEAQGQVGAVLVGRAELDHRDVLPAESRAVVLAEQALLLIEAVGGIADGLDLGVVDAHHVASQGPLRCGRPGKAQAVGFGNVEMRASGEQSGVFAETAHAGFGLPGGAQSEAGGHCARPAQPHTQAGGAVVAVVGEFVRINRVGLEIAQAVGAKSLLHQVEGDTHGVVVVELHGEGRRDENLLQIDPGARLQGRKNFRVATVHAAVAVHADADGHARVEHPVHPDFGDEKQRLVIARIGAGDLRASGRAHGRPQTAGGAHAAVGLEQTQSAVHAVADQRHAGRVGGCGQRILRQGDAHAPHAVGFDAVTRLKVTVGGLGGRCGEAGKDERKFFHGSGGWKGEKIAAAEKLRRKHSRPVAQTGGRARSATSRWGRRAGAEFGDGRERVLMRRGRSPAGVDLPIAAHRLHPCRGEHQPFRMGAQLGVAQGAAQPHQAFLNLDLNAEVAQRSLAQPLQHLRAQALVGVVRGGG